MKLIIAGASGFVGAELVRQSLENSRITSVVALARRPTFPPENLKSSVNINKLQSVVLNDFGSYPEDVKKHFTGADACIWTVAITPRAMREDNVSFDEVRLVCMDYTLTGLHAIFESCGNTSTSFRFLYISGLATERDQTKKPSFLPEYCLMRGETENRILTFAEEQKGKLEATVAKPGLITAEGRERPDTKGLQVPEVDVGVLSAGILEQVINGFEKDPLNHSDLVRLGLKALASS